jgi:hypothetical protein
LVGVGGSGVDVGVIVGVRVFVGVGVQVGMRVPVGVGVMVGVSVGVGVGLGVGVTVSRKGNRAATTPSGVCGVRATGGCPLTPLAWA